MWLRQVAVPLSMLGAEVRPELVLLSELVLVVIVSSNS